MEVNQAITLEAFEGYCKNAVDLYTKKKELEDEAEKIGKELEPLKEKLVAYLKHFEKENYKAAGYTLSITERYTVKMPADLTQKETFFNYLKERNIYSEMITVNSPKLNGWYKEEMDAAIKAGDIHFKIPGLDEPKLVENLSFRKAK